MLLVSFGCGLDGMVALLGRAGRGGSCVGLPAVEASSDFRPTKEPPDLLRRWPGEGLAWAGESAAFRGIGRGRLTTDAEVPGVSGAGTCFAAGLPAPLRMASTASGSLYSMLFTNRMVRCCEPGSSATLRPRALGFDGSPMVGRLCRGVFVGSGGGVFGDGRVLEGRIFALDRARCKAAGLFCGDSDRGFVSSGTGVGDGTRAEAGSCADASSCCSDWRGDLLRASSPPGDSSADVVDATATSSAPGNTLSRVATEPTSFRLRLMPRFNASSGAIPNRGPEERPTGMLSSSSCILALLSLSATAAACRSMTAILLRGFWPAFSWRMGRLMEIFPLARPGPFFFMEADLSSFRASPDAGAILAGSGGIGSASARSITEG